MQTLRIAMIASAALAAACVSTPNTPIAPTAPSVANVSGNWVLIVNTPNGPMNLTMSVAQDGQSISAKVTDNKGTYDYDGTVSSNAVNFGHDSINMPGMRIEYVGTVVAGLMSGKVTFGKFGEGTFSAERR